MADCRQQLYVFIGHGAVTLVVGERYDHKEIALVADSKITWERRLHYNPYFDGALKLIILRNALCVGFAGAYDEELPRRIFELRRNDLHSLLSTLRTAFPGNEFVIGSLEDGSRLFEIKGGLIRETSVAWAGDENGLVRFQQAHDARGMDSLGDRSFRLLTSLQHVLNVGDVSSVDGYHVRVSSTRQGFRFQADATRVFPQSFDGVITSTPKGTRLDLSGDEAQGMTMQCCPGIGPTFRACGFYVAESSSGALWRHQQPTEITHIRAANLTDFVALSRSKFGQFLAT